MVGNIDTLRMRVQRLNFWLIIVTLATTLGYAVFCLWQAFNEPTATSQNVESVLPYNPRLIIGLCWGAAAITLLFLPRIGRMVAAASLAGAFYTFVSWWIATSGIKTVLGVESIEGAGLFGNILIGAHFFDVFFALLTLAVLAFYACVLVLDAKMLLKRARMLFKRIAPNPNGDDASRLSSMVPHK